MKLTPVFEEDGEIAIAKDSTGQLYTHHILEDEDGPWKQWKKIDAYAVLYDASGVGKLSFETIATG